MGEIDSVPDIHAAAAAHCKGGAHEIAKAVDGTNCCLFKGGNEKAAGQVRGMVLDLVRRLRDQGLAVMVISHNLNDVFEVADRIAVMYLGRLVVQDAASKFDLQTVVEYMTTGGSSRNRASRPLES